MSFDPSALQDIQPPDIAGGVARGFQLKDMVDTQQLNQLKLKSEKSTLADDERTKDILSGADLSTDKGRAEAQEKLTKNRLPGKAMELGKYSQQVKSGELDDRMKQVELLHAQATEIDGLLTPVLSQAMAVSAKDPATAQAYVKAQLPLIKLAIRDSTVLDENVKKNAMAKIDQEMASPDPFSALKGALSANKQIMEQLKGARDERKVDVDERKATASEASEKERERHDRAGENAAAKKEEQRRKEATEGSISDDATNLAVDRMLNGEKAQDVLANFGRGKQGGANIAKVQNRLAEVAKERNINAGEISSRMIEMKGLVKEEQTEAAIAGKIRYSESEIKRIGPKVLELSDKVPRGKFVPWNQLRNYSKEQLSDPNLKQLKAYLTTLSNSYDVLGGRGGTDVEKRAHNRELLNAADSPQALKAAVDAIVQEAAISGEAATESETVDRSRLPGGKTDKKDDPLGIR
jgi:hypothetical protein